MAENKTHAESNVWMCILPIQQNGTDPSKVRMTGLRLVERQEWHLQTNFE